MANSRHRTVNEEEDDSEMSTWDCCWSIIFFAFGPMCLVTAAVLIGLRMVLIGLAAVVFGVAMLVAGVYICSEDSQKEPTETPVAGSTEVVATAPSQQQPFLEQHTRSRASYIMETNLTEVIIHEQPAVPADYSVSLPQTGTSYPDDVDPNCPPPPFSDSFAYPLKPASQSSEPAPPSYEEALNT